MSVNGITNSNAAYTHAATSTSNGSVKKGTAEEKNTKKTTIDSGVVYKSSKEESSISSTKKYIPNTALVNKLKEDADQRTSQLKSLVEKLMLGQGNAVGTADDMWSFLRTGDFTVDAATKAQAQADIAEDGYWGVAQTSDRILDFAKALCGDDPDKIEEMRAAFEKGFKQAEKTWGGKLPDISQRTYEATMKKFDDWTNKTNQTTVTENTVVE